MVVDLASAEDEMSNFGKVWTSIFLSLSYCYVVGKVTFKGFTRFISILPIIFIFLTLPLYLTSLPLCCFTAFFIAWLANFKLVLFAFGYPPLCSESHSPIAFTRFLALACLPIKFQNPPNPHQNLRDKSYRPPRTLQNSETNQYPDHKTLNRSHRFLQKVAWKFIMKGALIALIFLVYKYSNCLPQMILWLTHLLHVYLALEIVLAFVAKSAKLLLGLKLEPQFNEPLMSTSLQDFWGRRWNLMVSSIMRPLAFRPARDLSTRVLGPQLATLWAVMCTFLVSAFMHELIFFYMGRVRPTFEVTRFFLIHGFCLCLEIVAKKHVARKWRVSRWVSGPATVAMVTTTAYWLLLPPLLRAGLDTRSLDEYAYVDAFIRRLMGHLVPIT